MSTALALSGSLRAASFNSMLMRAAGRLACVLRGRPVAIMGASPTNVGTVRAQLSLRQLFPWTGSLVVGKPEVPDRTGGFS